MRKTHAESQEIAAFRRYLEGHGLRLTNDRWAIVKEIFATHNHFSMDDLFIALRLKGKRISKTTLYRNLPLMQQSGLIRRVPGDSLNGRFEHVLGHPHHDHLICMSCGREIEFTCNMIEQAQEAACRRYGFEPVHHRLGIWGYCHDCCQKKSDGRRVKRKQRVERS